MTEKRDFPGKPWQDRLRSRVLVFIHDLTVVPVAWPPAYWLRFNLGNVPQELVEDAL